MMDKKEVNMDAATFSDVSAETHPRLKTPMLCLYFVLCFAVFGHHSSAQEMKALSKDKKAPIVQIFYPKRNETVVMAPIGVTEDMANLPMPQSVLLGPSKNIELWEAQYVYQGKNPIRPQSVSFTFYVYRGKDKFREKQGFSVIGDGAIVQQGDLMLEQRTPGEHKSNTSNGITITVPTDTFLSISRAKKVEFKLGPVMYKLTEGELKHIRALAKTVEPLS